MLRPAYAAFLILAAGCEAVPDLRFADPEAGPPDSGAGADRAGEAGNGAVVSSEDSGRAGAQWCGTTMCINVQQPQQCSCEDCNQLHCVDGTFCCFDSQGDLSCKPNIAFCH
jgi:hypothetical protein